MKTHEPIKARSKSAVPASEFVANRIIKVSHSIEDLIAGRPATRVHVIKATQSAYGTTTDKFHSAKHAAKFVAQLPLDKNTMVEAAAVPCEDTMDFLNKLMYQRELNR